MAYQTYVSREPLDVIRANECESHPTSLATQRFRALWNEIERLRRLVDGAEEIFNNCTVSAGYCCCGDSMANHGDPMNCGHSPVDKGEYEVRQWIEEKKSGK